LKADLGNHPSRRNRTVYSYKRKVIVPTLIWINSSVSARTDGVDYLPSLMVLVLPGPP
jgi:hypothetical protein